MFQCLGFSSLHLSGIMAFSGKWTVSSFEGLKEVAEAFGVDVSKRDPAMLKGATLEIKQDGDTLTYTTTGGLGRTGTHTMTVGQQSEGELFGKVYSATTEWDGDTIVSKGQSGLVLRRSVEGCNLVYVIEYGGKSGKLVFTK